MTAASEHYWTRPHFYARDICKKCFQPRGFVGTSAPCPGSPSRNAKPNFFSIVERTLVDYFDTTGGDTIQEEDEWYLESGVRRVCLSELAMVIARKLARAP